MLFDVILPIFFIVFLGFLLRRLGHIDERVFARAQIYVLSPALVFMATARAETETVIILRILLFIAIVAAVMLGVVQGAGFLIKGDRCERQALSLTAVFMNSGFYGIPVCMLAFGEMGLIYATMFVVASSIVQNTLGVFLANAGRRSAAEALRTVFRLPILYAIVLARILAHLDALPPEPFMKMITLLGQAAIPLGLLLLGMQLEKIVADFTGRRAALERIEARPLMPDEFIEAGSGAGAEEPATGRDIGGGLLGAAIRIIGGYFIAVSVIRLFDFDPVVGNVLIAEAAMPTAVNVVVFATEFNCRPKLVAIGILGSTLASILSVTLILNHLG